MSEITRTRCDCCGLEVDQEHAVTRRLEAVDSALELASRAYPPETGPTPEALRGLGELGKLGKEAMESFVQTAAAGAKGPGRASGGGPGLRRNGRGIRLGPGWRWLLAAPEREGAR